MNGGVHSSIIRFKCWGIFFFSLWGRIKSFATKTTAKVKRNKNEEKRKDLWGKNPSLHRLGRICVEGYLCNLGKEILTPTHVGKDSFAFCGRKHVGKNLWRTLGSFAF